MAERTEALTPEEAEEVSAAALQRLRAESFHRAMTAIDQAGDMLAVERSRAKRWKAMAKVRRSIANNWEATCDMQEGEIALLERERDNAQSRAKRWKVSAKFWRRERERLRHTLEVLVDVAEQAKRERDEARAELELHKHVAAQWREAFSALTALERISKGDGDGA